MASGAIGLFDSGVGGLSVLKVLRNTFPDEDFVYIGDTARLPYGTKSSSTISNYARQISEKLKEMHVKCIIIACHSASSAFLQAPFDLGIPIFNVITPSCKDALERGSPIGVIGTQATVSGGIYSQEIGRHSEEPIQVYSQACPLLVPLVEEGWEEDPITNLIVFRYISPFEQLGLKSLIMGCTHFPMLEKAIGKVLGPDVQLIHPGESIAKELIDEKHGLNINTSNEKTGKVRFLTTDTAPLFKEISQRIMGGSNLPDPEHIDIA